MEIKEIQEAVEILKDRIDYWGKNAGKDYWENEASIKANKIYQETIEALQTLIQTAQEYIKLKERISVERIGETIKTYKEGICDNCEHTKGTLTCSVIQNRYHCPKIIDNNLAIAIKSLLDEEIGKG